METMDVSKGREITKEDDELLLLINFDANEVDNLPLAVRNILDGQYEIILNNELPSNTIEMFNMAGDIEEFVNKNIETGEASLSWFHMAIASLLYFVQCNWTSSRMEKDVEWLKSKRKDALKELSLQDECNVNVKLPELLYFSKIVFSNEYLQNVCKTCIWWMFRANVLHQQILNESLGNIYDKTEELIRKIHDSKVWNESLYCEILFYLEVTQFYFHYRRVQSSEKYVKLAQEKAKLSLELQGALGKRTKFQMEDKAQLFLKISLDKDQFPMRPCEDLPKTLNLNDDVRLDSIKFSEDIHYTRLGSLEEAIVSVKHIQLQLSQPKDAMADEEVKPYLNTIIENTKNWSLKVASLYYRCLLESGDKRTVERSMMQMESLINDLKDPSASLSHRLDLFFASGLKPVWVLEELWAKLMLSLGLIKSALDVFLRINLWEEVVTCYNLLDLKHKAAEIIRQEIAKEPTVQLWCLLGDATDDPSHYETAWKLSNEKNSRAQRHWGFYFFKKKNYEEAIPHLKLSVELNNIQERVWMSLGFAALQTEDWKLAVTAYKRYCALEPSTFESWNNVAKAYIKLGDKAKAWKSLQDAIKCNYDQWQIWDNLMIVSIDLGHFSEVIRCYHRMLDLKGKHLDIQILEILTNALINNINDSGGNPVQRLLPKTMELFGRISSFQPNDFDFWRMYGQLSALKDTDVDKDKAMQSLQQAYRIAISNNKWMQQEKSVEKVLKLCYVLAEMYLKFAPSFELKRRKALLASAKLSVQGVVKRVKDQKWTSEKILTCLQTVEEQFNMIVNELEQINLIN